MEIEEDGHRGKCKSSSYTRIAIEGSHDSWKGVARSLHLNPSRYLKGKHAVVMGLFSNSSISYFLFCYIRKKMTIRIRTTTIRLDSGCDYGSNIIVS